MDVTAEAMMQYHSLAISNFFFIDGCISIDPQALRDFKDKRHTLNRVRWAADACGDERLEKYVEKIQAKYPWPIREAK